MSNQDNAEIEPGFNVLHIVKPLTKTELKAQLEAIEKAEALAFDTFKTEILETIVENVIAPDVVIESGGMRLILVVGFDSDGTMLLQIETGPQPKATVAKSGMDMRVDYKAVDGHTARGPKGPAHYDLIEGDQVIRPDGKVLGVNSSDFSYGSEDGSLSGLALIATGQAGKKDKRGNPLTVRGPEYWFSAGAKVRRGSATMKMVEYQTGSGHDWKVETN